MNSEKRLDLKSFTKNSANDRLRNAKNPCSRAGEILLECQYFRSDFVMNSICSEPGIGIDHFTAIERLITLLTRRTEGLEPKEDEELQRLMTEYNVKSGGDETLKCYSVRKQYPTYERLRAMFPHVAMSEKLKLINPTIEPVNHNPQLHPAFYLPEFGGLIPISEKFLNKESRDTLILLHLSAQEKLRELPIPLSARHVILKKQLESSLLSNDRRLQQLVSLGLIHGDGNLTLTTKAALAAFGQSSYS